LWLASETKFGVGKSPYKGKKNRRVLKMELGRGGARKLQGGEKKKGGKKKKQLG